MKKLLFCSAIILSTFSVLAQGTVVFANRVAGTLVTRVYFGPQTYYGSQTGNGPADYPVGTTDWTGFTPLEGSGFMAALRAAPGSGVPVSNLLFSSDTTTFRTGAAAGYVNAVTATLPNVSLDAAVATIQMFVWDNSSGNYSSPSAALAAFQSGTIVGGFSNPFNVQAIGGQFNVPPYLVGLQSFSLVTIPEPSAVALLALGCFGMWMRRIR